MTWKVLPLLFWDFGAVIHHVSVTTVYKGMEKRLQTNFPFNEVMRIGSESVL